MGVVGQSKESHLPSSIQVTSQHGYHFAMAKSTELTKVTLN
jgi:hypothetical protein